ncbi:Leucine-rich repeat domain, L domain-like [Phytophthora cactorum]|nr:Leucine-rich repeat domain, L domain-like [Phytophthora cactorum]
MQSLRALPSDEDGGREVFEAPLQPKFQSNATPAPPQKIYPLAAPAKNSAKGPSQSFNSHETAGRQGKNTIRFQAMLAVAVCICLGWTLWLILLNVAPNDTVNRVMNTENFDYGSFWLMVDPSKTMVGFATFGLSVVVIGYLGVFVKMLTTLHSSKRSYLVHQRTNKGLKEKVGKALKDAADQRTGSRVTSTTVQLAFSLTRRQFGSKTHSVVVTNALACAAMMFVPHERAPLAETLIDILFDFLIIVGCPMLVVFYCLSSFTFDRAKFAINLEVFPAGWFEQGASVIADAEQTAVIYESLKSLRIMTPLNFFTRIGVNMTLCFRLWHLVDNLHGDTKQKKAYTPSDTGVLPDELRRCKSLRHLSLEYTHTQTFPAWVKEFTKLEYLNRRIPDFSPIKDLKFAVSDRGAWCCNGFLGTCDLSNGNCGVHPLWGSPAVSCLDPNRTENVATPVTLAAVEKFDATTCGPVLQPGVLEGPPTPEIMAPCNGTMYRQCGNAQAMCYNARFMGIACTTTRFPLRCDGDKLRKELETHATQRSKRG